ncbi:MAG: integrase arm-type DNA-binding domain-containing protein [Pseudomonadota bacterium]
MPKAVLTDQQVKGVKCPEDKRFLDIADGGASGLTLRVSDKGQKSWVFRYRFGGKQRRLTLGNYPGDLSLANAREAVGDLRKRVRRGDDPAAPAPLDELRSFRALLNARIASLEAEGRSMRYIDEMRRALEKYVLPKLGTKLIDEITAADVASVFGALTPERECSGKPVTLNATYNRTLSMTAAVFNFANFTHNPCASLKKRKETHRETLISLDELRSIWTSLDHSEAGVTHILSCAIRLSAATLVRSGAVAGATPGEFNLSKRTWTIPGTRMKNGQPFVVPLTDMAIDIVHEALGSSFRPSTEPSGDQRFLFPARGDHTKSMPQLSISKAFAKARRHAGIPDADDKTLHGLRHAGATLLAEEGVPPFIVSLVLSHTPAGAGMLAVTNRYARYSYLEERRKALELWERLVREVLAA